MSHTTLSHHNTCMRNTVTVYIVQAGELCCWAREESTEVSEYGGACCLDVEQCLASGTANRNHKHWLRATLGVGMTGCYIGCVMTRCYIGCGDNRVLYWVWEWQGVIYIVPHGALPFLVPSESYMKCTGGADLLYVHKYVQEYTCIVDNTAWLQVYIKQVRRIWMHNHVCIALDIA